MQNFKEKCTAKKIEIKKKKNKLNYNSHANGRGIKNKCKQ